MDGWTGNLPVMCYSREDESFRLLTCLGLPFIDFFFPSRVISSCELLEMPLHLHVMSVTAMPSL